MKFLGSSFFRALLLVVLLSSCAIQRSNSVSEVSGCVETEDLPAAGHCVHAELHRFRGGVLLAPGAYHLEDRKLLKDGLCFKFFADTGERMAIKTRDSDRVLIGGSVYVIAGDASTNLFVRHQRHRGADPGSEFSCERPLGGRLGSG